MLLLENLKQFDVQLQDFLVTLGLIGLLLALLLAALCSPFLAMAAEISYVSRRKAFYDKCALQIAQAGCCLGFLLFVLAAAGTGLFLFREMPELFQSVPRWSSIRPHLLPFIPPLAALILFFLYLFSWNLLKKTRFVHLLLGCMVTVLCLGITAAAFLLIGAAQEPFLAVLLRPAPLTIIQALALDFLNSPNLWLGLGYALTFGFAVCASCSQTWLIFRREKADYGRDYYAFAMRYCARAALFFTLVATALATGLFWRLSQFVPPSFSQPYDVGVLAISAGMPLSCCLLWLCMVKSDAPMRHKLGVFFSLVFLIVALCAQLMLFSSAFPMM